MLILKPYLIFKLTKNSRLISRIMVDFIRLSAIKSGINFWNALKLRTLMIAIKIKRLHCFE